MRQSLDTDRRRVVHEGIIHGQFALRIAAALQGGRADSELRGRSRTPERRAPPGIPPSPTVPHSLGYAQPTSTSLTGRLEARPHNVRRPGLDPNPKQTRSPRKPRPIGVPGLTLCRIDHPASRRSPHNVTPGSPGERDAVCSSGYEAGRRRAIGVVAAVSSTHARPRRWRDAGPPGRQCVTAAQKAGVDRTPRTRPWPWPWPRPRPGIPSSPTVPHSLGYAQPT